ncbi:glutathione S-transferase [Panacagrimonas perspica]|uniref:Glutathione S-transferase n=1 Tax=Panacagrimonas perspica TaxID=381431 RepID=A0A4R7PE58_9GAMM|nr:glutathione S-transferase family protein [Panacagrimonas perspica]TDU32387.1 glutathione S-transferase [Panacagrimonas perspica]THD05318.1 glutathione S-transferase [Panacagrimonas perspica]
MSLKLYGHPFSSYCQKVLIALYENATPFEFRVLSPDHPEIAAEHAKLWPLKRFPVLADGDRTVLEASLIVEYLDQRYAGSSRLIPEDRDAALQVRTLDRFFDNYVMTPMQAVVFDAIRPADQRRPYIVTEAFDQLDVAYGWLEGELQGRKWAIGDDFGLADCAAAPSLFYADWVRPIGSEFPTVRAYRERLLSRPSFARAVNEARPYRSFFPLGAPDCD